MIITKLVTNAGAFDIIGKTKDEVLAEIKACWDYYIVTKETTASYQNKLQKDNITIYVNTAKLEILAIEEHIMSEMEEVKPLKSKKK